MMAWVDRHGEATFLIAYDRHFHRLAELVECGDDWTVRVGEQAFKLNGSGCPDPLRYIEHLVSPWEHREREDNSALMIYKDNDAGTTWQVFSVMG